MPHPRYSSHEIVERGQALFDRDIRDTLDAGARGMFLALDIETGELEIDEDELTALKRARAKHPDAALYLIRVGHSTACRLRSLDVEDDGAVTIEPLAGPSVN